VTIGSFSLIVAQKASFLSLCAAAISARTAIAERCHVLERTSVKFAIHK
jgi:hypothetical protein